MLKEPPKDFDFSVRRHRAPSPLSAMFYQEERQMRFLSRSTGLFQSTSGAREEYRSAGRRRLPMTLETLETRNLMSVPGVSLSYGNLLIQAPTGSSGNVAKV